MENVEERLNADAEKLIKFGEKNPYVDTAFYHVFGKRLINQGYVDGSYILEASTRGTYYTQLKEAGSTLRVLFSSSCIVSENVETMLNYLENIMDKSMELERLEEEALVFWIFLPYLNSAPKREKRPIYLRYVLEKMLSKWTKAEGRNWNLAVSQGIIFDKSSCSLESMNSVADYARYIFQIKRAHSKEMLFYRGHSQLNYILQPGIKRVENWLENEDIMYQELLVRCAEDFAHCHTHLDYLVEMQHYGLPTRLLDITENPLVALYFACSSRKDKAGEVFVLRAEHQNIKYAKSDTVAVLSALPTLSYQEQQKLYRMCMNGIPEDSDEEYQILAGKLAAEVKSRNPAFEARICKKDLLGYAFVIPIRNNQRIVKQEGAFIICGIDDDENRLEHLCCKDEENKRIVLMVKDKEKILKELDMFSINRAGLFPEIDDVAEYIREKYQ